MESSNLDFSRNMDINTIAGEEATTQPKRNYQKLASKAVSVGSFAGLYCMILICMATVFILTTFIGRIWIELKVHYTQVFTIIVYGIGGIFTSSTYGYVHILKKKIAKIKAQVQKDDDRKNQVNIAFVSESVSLGESATSSSRAWKSTEEVKVQYEQKPPVAFNAEGASFFSRMGLIGFGLGTTLLDGMRMMQYIEHPNVLKCLGWLYFSNSGVNIFFVWCEMFFLLKNHTIIINFHHVLMKFGLAHLIAANMSTWIITVVIEGALSLPSGNDTDTSTECLLGTIYYEASPYLYPFVIEFSLLAAAFVYRINANIGVLVLPKERPVANEEEEQHETNDCHRSNTGLFYGFIIFVGIVCATCLYIYYDVQPSEGTEHSLPGTILHDGGGESFNYIVIYFYTGITVGVLSFIVLIPTILKLHRLRYVVLDSMLDQHLLVVAVFGYYMLLGLSIIPAIFELREDEGNVEIARLVISLASIEFVQVTLQVVVISHGLRRRAWSAAQEQLKPGRSLLIFLIVINMGLWILNTFMQKGLHHLNVISDFYGLATWAILLHMFLPLSIFYRFHAAVCFAEIWSNAYTRVEHCRITFTEIARESEEQTSF